MFDIKGILDPVVAIINKVIPDRTQAAAAVAQLQILQVQGALSEELLQLQAVTVNQSAVNQVEAANPSMFVAGARPAIMWICAAALALQFLGAPLFTWATALAGKVIPFPSLDMGTLMTLLFGMLGLGAMRTYEKQQGVDTKDVAKK